MESSILIKSVKIIDTQSTWHQQTVDMRIVAGQIQNIAPELSEEATDQVVYYKGLCASQGWLDMGAMLNEPGYEHKDDLDSLCTAATTGGFTAIATFPNTQPTIQTKDAIRAIKAHEHLVELFPMATLTLNATGEQMTEMVDLNHAGAIAFSDGPQSTYHTALLAKCLQYLQIFDGLLIHRAQTHSLSQGKHMHEGIVSTMMGTNGIPSVAEEIAIARDLSLLSYTGGKIHFSMLSTAKGVDLIREAKQKGLRVTCDVAAHQMSFTDEAMQTFDTNFKVDPPFREQTDIDALWAGIADGTIDAIISAHTPQDTESKELEFDLADFGALGLETAFAALQTAAPKHISLETLIEKLTTGPRNILKLPHPSITVGAKACLSLFDPNKLWTVTKNDLKSKSKNSPFIRMELQGKPVGIIKEQQIHLNQ